MASSADRAPTSGGDSRVVYRYAAPGLNLFCGCGMAIGLFAVGVLTWGLCVVIRDSRTSDLWMALLALFGALFYSSLLGYLWRASLQSRIETSGDRILYVQGKKRVDESLEDVSTLAVRPLKDLTAYEVAFKDGKRIRFGADMEGAERLARHIEAGSGRSFGG